MSFGRYGLVATCDMSGQVNFYQPEFRRFRWMIALEQCRLFPRMLRVSNVKKRFRVDESICALFHSLLSVCRKIWLVNLSRDKTSTASGPFLLIWSFSRLCLSKVFFWHYVVFIHYLKRVRSIEGITGKIAPIKPPLCGIAFFSFYRIALQGQLLSRTTMSFTNFCLTCR